ncbi:hypothetical protein KC19_4G025600 [Ceratodon purpureus]|nr:hypothetical protein KC19_4G025600 [Ceratodon purpureus]KAG0578470.1 hypothetical protein KC19_4G025600 [Ceratodon purpureus]
MQMAFHKGVRIRLSFEEDGMLSEEQIEQGLNKSWYLVNPQLLTIGQLSSWITVDFRLGNSCPNGVTLEMSGFALPPTQPTTLLQDAELVSVKRKRRSTAEELVSVAAVAPSTFIAKTGGKENGAHFVGVEIRPLDALELETRSNQSEIVEKGVNKSKFKAVEIGLQLLRTKETVRRRKRMHEPDIQQRSKEPSTWKSNETDPDETEPDDDEDLERPNRKDAMQSSGDESLSRPGDQPERRTQIKEELPTSGQIDGLSTSMTEDRKGGGESGDEKEIVGNPGAYQVIVAPNLHLMGQPIQERHSHHQKYHSSGRDQTLGPRSTRENPSEGNDTWCRNRFDVWRKQQGMDINKSIEDMPYEELGALLSKFFLMICKDNGQRYPSASLMNLYMSFNRIIGKAQQERARRLGVQEDQFKIQTHPCFQKATQSCHKAMELSRFSGVNKRRKKAACISLEVEKQILAHPEHQATFPTGVQKRLAYYLWTVFLIRGNEEMWNLKFQDFSICVDEKGIEFLQ